MVNRNLIHKARFKQGDIIEIAKYWDQCNDVWLEGIVLIKEVTYWKNRADRDEEFPVYQLKKLKGNITAITYNSIFFDKLEYLAWLGNIEEDDTLRILYGQNDR